MLHRGERAVRRLPSVLQPRVKTYGVSEVFYSLQGEGAMAGTPSVFLRLRGCNMICTEARHGFTCDTKHNTGATKTHAEILDMLQDAHGDDTPGWVIVTGGEPTLQLDCSLVAALKRRYQVAVETNGTRSREDCPALMAVDWISCSPKRDASVALQRADEVRVVVEPGMRPEDAGVLAQRKYVSPRAVGGKIDPGALGWAVSWCKANPSWCLSIQQQTVWGIR